MRRWIASVALLLAMMFWAAAVHAQTRRLSWDFQNTQLAAAQSWTQTMQLGTNPAQTITPTCTQSAAAVVTCSAPLPAGPIPTTIVVTASNAHGSTTGTYSGANPAPIVNIRIVIDVTVP